MSANRHEAEKGKLPKAVITVIVSWIAVLAAAVIKIAISTKGTSYITYLCFAAGLTGISLAQLVYMLTTRVRLVNKPRSFAAVYAAMSFSCITCIYLEFVSIYLMPVILSALLIAPLSRHRDAFSSNIFCNLIIGFTLFVQYSVTGKSMFAVVVMIFAGLTCGSIASYWVANNTRRLSFLLKGFAMAALGTGMVFLLLLVFNGGSQTGEIIKRDWMFVLIGFFAQVPLCLALQPVFESVFNLITNTRLVELTDHNSPLINRLISEAPGTFNHSLAVANFAEMCAAAIGENPYLARTCAYYHDIGKLTNPQYFKENQADYNPHDELLPEVSAEIIRSHTTEGKRLCEMHRIPQEVADITVQHHGTLPIYVFYNKAKQLTDGEVDINEYCYHGVKPISKIAAIIMLCDSGEAAIRAMDNPDGERVDKLLKKLIDDRISAGQFDDCDISLRDLNKIRKTIISAYGGQFHKRMAYPDGRSSTLQ